MASDRKRSWLSRVLDRGAPVDAQNVGFELVVIEGADEGARFPIDRSQIQIGRAAPGVTTPPDSEILLSDRSVSSKQAIIAREDGKLTLQHLPSATNPTLVNGRKIKQKRLREGDRVALGLVVLEVRSVHPVVAVRAPAETSISTDPIHMVGELVVTEGPDALIGTRFPLERARTSLGRENTCDIVLDVGAVSRTHASVVWEDDQLVIVHESQVNPTDVNGRRIHDRRRLFDGDEIRLSERVTLGVVLSAQAAPTADPSLAFAAADAHEATRLTTPPAAPAPPEAPTAVGAASGPDAPDAPTMLDAAVAAETPPEEATAISAPDYSEGDRTTATDPPPPPSYSEGDETRVAEAPPADDGDRTMLRESPFASPPQSEAPEPPKTQVVDLDAELAKLGTTQPLPAAPGDDDKTMIRPVPQPEPSPYSDGERTVFRQVPNADSAPDAAQDEPEPDAADADTDADPDKTVFRPVPNFDEPAATRIIEPDEDD